LSSKFYILILCYKLWNVTLDDRQRGVVGKFPTQCLRLLILSHIYSRSYSECLKILA